MWGGELMSSKFLTAHQHTLENTEQIEDKLIIQTIQKLNTTQKSKQRLTQQNKLPWFSPRLRHSARKQGGPILQRSRAHTGHAGWVLIVKEAIIQQRQQPCRVD